MYIFCCFVLVSYTLQIVGDELAAKDLLSAVFWCFSFPSVESTALRLITALGSSEVQPQFTRFLSDPKTVLSAESEELNRALILTLARATHVTGNHHFYFIMLFTSLLLIFHFISRSDTCLCLTLSLICIYLSCYDHLLLSVCRLFHRIRLHPWDLV